MASNSSSSAAGVSSKAADFKPVASTSSTSKFAPVVKKEEPAPVEFDEKELERILNAESTTLQREEECQRVLGAFKLNPYEILGVELTATEDDIQKTYRKKSLMIHPDRFKAARGPEAFDLLKKAQTDLSNPDKRKILDQTIADARMLILRGLNVPTEAPDSHDKLRFLQPTLKERVKQKTKELLIDEELRRRRTNKMQMIAEGAEAQRIDKEANERKRKAAEKAAWEESRETRVGDWRSFQKGGQKRKRPKPLG